MTARRTILALIACSFLLALRCALPFWRESRALAYIEGRCGEVGIEKRRTFEHDLLPRCVSSLVSRTDSLVITDASVDEAMLSDCRSLEEVRHICFREASVTVSFNNLFASFPRAKSIGFSHCTFSAKNDSALSIANSILELEIEDCELSPDTLKSLPGFPHLRILSLRGTSLDDRAIDFITSHPTLIVLQLEGTSISDHGIARLDALPELAVLGVAGTKITDAAVEALHSCRSLACLFIDHTQISDTGMMSLSKMHGMHELSISTTRATAEGLLSLLQNPGLQVVNIRDQSPAAIAFARECRRVRPEIELDGPDE